MKHARRRIIFFLALIPLILRPCPECAWWMLENLSVPGMVFIHRLTAPVPFPVAEPLALGLILLAPAGLLRARAASRPPKCLPWTLFALLLAFILLWAPALAVPVPDIPAPDAGALTRLCARLVDQLNAAPLSFPEPADALARAPAVAGLPGGAVKAVRYPEWMALAGAWGMFIPLTGEAVVDPLEPAPLVPFTAVHELMHLTGIADEGAANIAAWEKCMAAGGPFADSARLWALRYAMGQLHLADPAAWQKMRTKMEGATLRAFLSCGAEAEAPPRRLSITRGDYAALAGYLANAPEIVAGPAERRRPAGGPSGTAVPGGASSLPPVAPAGALPAVAAAGGFPLPAVAQDPPHRKPRDSRNGQDQ
jgi:hypothetical protein